MSVIIPFRDLPAFRETVSLDETLYIFEFQYNTRADYWTMSIYSKEGTRLLTGVKVVLNFELIQRYGSRNLPPGPILGVDVTEIIERIGRRELPDAVELVYIPEAELV